MQKLAGLYQFIYYIILFLLSFSSLTKIDQRNRLKQEAQEAFRKKDYEKASVLYKKLEDISFFVEPSLRMNYAHANYILKKDDDAKSAYQKILKYQDESLVSTALNQIGLIYLQKADSVKALQIFKEAIQKDTDNQFARYNYELLKMKFTPPSSSVNNKNQSSSHQNNESSEAQNSDEKQNELKSTNPKRMSREKALQLLDAMRNNESQNFNRKVNTKKSSKEDKDW